MGIDTANLIASLVVNLISNSSIAEKLGELFVDRNKDPYEKALKNSLQHASEIFLSHYKYDKRFMHLLEYGVVKNQRMLEELSKYLTISEEPDFDRVLNWGVRNGFVDDFDLTIDETNDAIRMLFALVESELRKQPILREHFNSRTIHQILLIQNIELSRVREHEQTRRFFGESWLFPQIKEVRDKLLQEQLERIVDLLNIEYVDLGLFSLARLLETELKQTLLIANEKELFQVSSRDFSNLASMIDCAVNNGIFPNREELHYLRKERNKRVHGNPPEISERKKLMRWTGFLGDQYIEYILLARKYQDTSLDKP
jgi:hypothetical protein